MRQGCRLLIPLDAMDVFVLHIPVRSMESAATEFENVCFVVEVRSVIVLLSSKIHCKVLSGTLGGPL